MDLLATIRSRLTRSVPSPRAEADTENLFDEDFQRRLETLALVSRRVFEGRLRAERRSRKKGSGVEFADHRSYVPGDDFRFVDWNVYQRFGRLLVRLYEEEEDLSIYFLVDCSGSMGFAGGKKFRQARRLCAALAYVGLAHLDRVTVVGINDALTSRMPTTRGKGRIFRLLDFLSNLEARGGTHLEEALRTFVAQHKRRGLVVLISDLYDPHGFEAAINVLRFNKFEPYVLHVVDETDTALPALGDVRLADCETGDECELTLTDRLVTKIHQTYRNYLASIESFCTTTQVSYFRANVNFPFDELVLQVFRRGGFLR